MFCHSFKKNTNTKNTKSCGGSGLKMALFTMYLTALYSLLPFIISVNKIYFSVIRNIILKYFIESESESESFSEYWF